MNRIRCADHQTPQFRYHLLRSALEGFSKNLTQLDQSEYDKAYRKASRSFDLESLVLGSQEAGEMIVSEHQLEQSVQEVATRYSSREEFHRDLESNGLDETGLRSALYRELKFNNVMQSVAVNGAEISDIDVRLFYELQHERFSSPEQRIARHILITVNPDYPENTFHAARSRLEVIEEKLAGRANRFQDFAKRYSECPTAMEGGSLGKVKRGQLYAELDAALFSMDEPKISPIVETELGFHLLFCEKIIPSVRTPFAKAEPRIRQYLTQRQQRNCQKAWIAELQKAAAT